MTTTKDISLFLANYDEQVINQILNLRKMIIKSLPDIIEQIDTSAKMIAYTYGQKYADLICVIIPSKKEVKLGFNRGIELPDPDKLLEGTGKISRYVEIKPDNAIPSKALSKLFQYALKNYKQHKPDKKELMWICPVCKHKFYNKNQSHSCGNFTVEDFLKGKSVIATDLFNHLIAQYKKIGDFDIHPVKTRIALLTKMRFCSINKIGKDYIDVHLVLTQPYPESLCFYKIDNLADRFFIHHLKLHRKPDVNKELIKYMKLAYETGNRKHVEIKK